MDDSTSRAREVTADVEMQDVEHSDPAEAYISQYTSEQRQRYFKKTFLGKVEPLCFLSQPNESLSFPTLSKEIDAAYLEYTTFTVEVWANYDAITKRLFNDTRIQDCGKLRLKPKDRADYLKKLAKTDKFQLNRVRLEIGTPFKTICHVNVRTKPSKLNVGPNVHATVKDYSNGEHPNLLEFVRATAENEVEDCALPFDQQGFLLSDIKEIASMFVREPAESELRQKLEDPNEGPWMSLRNSNEENLGWVDFKALGKWCSNESGCRGCNPRKPWHWKSLGSIGTARPVPFTRTTTRTSYSAGRTGFR